MGDINAQTRCEAPLSTIALDDIRLQQLASKIAGDALSIEEVRRLSGGASQETWAFDLRRATGKVSCVLRRAPGGVLQQDNAAGMETEAAVILHVQRHGVPVPDVLYVLRPEDGLGRGFVTAAVPGETIARKVMRDDAFATARAEFTSDCAAILAAVHATPIQGLPPLQSASASATLAYLKGRVGTLSAPRPVFELALRWLADNLPVAVDVRLVHGDFRLGNLIMGPEGIRAVLDWECVHLGDPMEDLAWLCAMPWRFGAAEMPVAGLGEREALYAAYERIDAGRVDEKRVRWWEVLASLRWGVECAWNATRFREGSHISVERAMIARRASESEIDLLRMIYLGDS